LALERELSVAPLPPRRKASDAIAATRVSMNRSSANVLFEQLLRFLNFGQILPRIEIDENWREQLRYLRRSTVCDVEARKSKRAAQLKRLRLLASSDLQRSIECIFGGANIWRFITQQKLTTNTMQLGIEPMLAGLLCTVDQLS